MGLLGSLGLPEIKIPGGGGGGGGATATSKPPVKPTASPTPPAAPEAPLENLPQTTVTLVNASANALKLVKGSLEFGGTAKFEPVLPQGIPPKGKVVFHVIEPKSGAKKTAGMAWYAYDGRKGKVDVIFGWSGRKAEVKVIGDGTFTRQAQAVEDLDRGNEYRMLFADGSGGAVEMLPPIEDPDEQPVTSEKPETSAKPENAETGGKPNEPQKVTIVNETGSALTFAGSAIKQDASLKSDPPKTIDGGRTARLEVVSATPDWPATAGLVQYSFTVDNPEDPNAPGSEQVAKFEWEGNQWSGSVRPGAEGFEVKVEGSTGDYLFILKGPKLEFAPPAEAKEPTLRKGDKSGDGWVEYLQSALNHHINAGLEVDGDFGKETLKAVKAFQRKYKKEGVLEDGIVGDQTWSYLREGAPAKPKTDGRKAHSFVEKGAEARWFKEKDWVIYDYGGDALLMMAVSVGDVALVENRKVRFKVVNPAGVQKVLDRPVGPAIEQRKDERIHMVAIQQFSTLFDESHTGNAVGGDYQVTAYFPADLGGDSYDGVLNIAG